jgi:hypothetical protein
MTRSPFSRRTATVAVVGAVLLGVGCPAKTSVTVPAVKPTKNGPGSIGVVILVDTSGSMKEPPRSNRGDRKKFQMANDALAEILRQTAAWAKDHPNKPLNVSIYNFSTTSRPVLPLGEFDDAAAQQAVKNIPLPEGGTAIGLALQDAWNTLKPVGCERQFILCITDGENRNGPEPRDVVPNIHKDSKGKVEIHFIAFDVDSHLFDFIKEYDGHVVSAGNKEELDAALKRIFEKRILLEGDE